ncbi:MAG: hypothetical protein GQ528_11300 [Woeseiaceae bacterium]|nr:hypothetical protein [Woeseiaceae bacterium]
MRPLPTQSSDALQPLPGLALLAGESCGFACGVVSFIQRFGSALNLNLHFHTLALDEATTGVENVRARTERCPASTADATPEVDLHDRPPDRAARRRYRWAELLQRVFEIDTLRCPRCGSTLRLIAAIEDPAVAGKILECLKLPARSPPIETASWAAIPPDPIAPNRDADWEFDQSRPAREGSGPP